MQPHSSFPQHANGSAESTQSPRIAGFGLIALAALTVLFMAMHPTAGTSDPGEFVQRAGRGIPGNTLVHGVLISLILLMAACFLSLRDLLGPRRLLVRGGLVALAVGTAGAVAAGLVNGFIVPNTASHFLNADPARVENLQIQALQPVLTFAREANATCARVSMVGLSLTAVTWSARLLALPGWRRGAGALGLALGLAPLGLHAGEHLQINVPGYGLFILIHAGWAIVAGTVMIRWRPAP